MKKNSQIHIYLETDLIERLKKEAQEEKLSLSSVCRFRLNNYDIRLKKIESTLDEVVNLLKSRRKTEKYIY